MQHQEAHYLRPETAAELKQIYLIVAEFGTVTGPHLLHDAILAALAADHRWLWLVVFDRNLRARAFYKKLNFQLLGAG